MPDHDHSDPRPEGLAKYRPHLRYLLIDEGEFAEDELNPLQNLVAGLFALENARTAQDVQRILESVRQCYDEQDPNELQRALVVWLKRVMLPARLPGIEIPEVNTLQEMNAMLAERVVEWTQEWKREGLLEVQVSEFKCPLMPGSGADRGFSRPSAAGKPRSSVHGCIDSVSRKAMIHAAASS